MKSDLAGRVQIAVARDSAKMRERSADKLVAQFERMIREGHLAEGETLPPEREIVQNYGVSRTVAREAVLSLANKGLVDARPGFRPVVRKPTFDTAINILDSLVPQLLRQPDGVQNLCDMRILIEASLVRTAALDATRDDMHALKAALEENGAAIHDAELFYKTDMAFHAVLYRIPGNPLLPAVHRAYTNWLAPHWSQMPRMETRNQQNFAAHTEIYEAILMRDPDAAEASLRSHLRSAWEQVKATFDNLE